MAATAAVRDTREDFFTRAAQKNLSPLWPILDKIASDEPRSPCVPALWRYKEVRPFLMEAAALISAQEAERRVMVLENPGMEHANRITHSLYAGAPPYGECLALHRRGGWRLHHGGRRENHSAPWRFRHHAGLDLA
jgi:gentisate 1,2-dioxygenase